MSIVHFAMLVIYVYTHILYMYIYIYIYHVRDDSVLFGHRRHKRMTRLKTMRTTTKPRSDLKAWVTHSRDWKRNESSSRRPVTHLTISTVLHSKNCEHNGTMRHYIGLESQQPLARPQLAGLL